MVELGVNQLPVFGEGRIGCMGGLGGRAGSGGIRGMVEWVNNIVNQLPVYDARTGLGAWGG